MSKELNIIGDIAGNFNTLKALLKKMPHAATPFSVGDMCDRGPSSREVMEFFMNNGLAVLGNHDHMMLCEVKGKDYYDQGVWFGNGGFETLKSFFPEIEEDRDVVKIVDSLTSSFMTPSYFYDPDFEDDKSTRYLIYKNVLSEYYERIDTSLVKWLEGLPLFYEQEGLFVSHAPKRPGYSLKKCSEIGVKADYQTDETLLWNRGTPRRMKDKTQIFGHNSYKKVKYFEDKQGTFAIGIDTSRSKILTGIHWPSLQIYEQEIID